MTDPFYSSERTGQNLQLRVEGLTPHTETITGYRVLTAAAHTATKIAALLDRPDSTPGLKDRIEILTMLWTADLNGVPAIIAAASAQDPAKLPELIDKTFTLLDEAPQLNRSARSRLRETRKRWQQNLALSLSRQGMST